MDELRTERLLLRRIRASDAEDYFRLIHGDPEVMRFLGGAGARTRKDSAMVVTELSNRPQGDRGRYFWIIEVDGALAGHAGLMPLEDTPEVEVFYALGQPYWGCSIATEAARACLTFGFEQAGLDHIVAVAYPENVASQRVMQKLGMTFEGHTLVYGKDMVRYTISRDAFTAQPDSA